MFLPAAERKLAENSYFGQVSSYIKDASLDIADSVALLRDLHLGKASSDAGALLARLPHAQPRNAVGGQVSGLIFRMVGLDEEVAEVADVAEAADVAEVAEVAGNQPGPVLHPAVLDGQQTLTPHTFGGPQPAAIRKVSSGSEPLRPRWPLDVSVNSVSSPLPCPPGDAVGAELTPAAVLLDGAEPPAVARPLSGERCPRAEGCERHRQRRATFAQPEWQFPPNTRRRSWDDALARKYRDVGVHANFFPGKKAEFEVPTGSLPSPERARPPDEPPPTPNRACKDSEARRTAPAPAGVAGPAPVEEKPPDSPQSVGQRLSAEPGHDHPHDFAVVNLITPADCDFCHRFIWGVQKQGLQCRNCKYFCHERCRKLVPGECCVKHLHETAAATTSQPGSRGAHDDNRPDYPKRLKVVCHKSHVFELAIFLGITTCVPCGKVISYMARLSWKCRLCGCPSHARCIRKLEQICPNGAKVENPHDEGRNANPSAQTLIGGVLPRSQDSTDQAASVVSTQKIRTRRNSSVTLFNVGQRALPALPFPDIPPARPVVPPRIVRNIPTHLPLPTKVPRDRAIPQLAAATSPATPSPPQPAPQEPAPIVVRGHPLSFAAPYRPSTKEVHVVYGHHDSSALDRQCGLCVPQDESALNKIDRGTVLECGECGLRCHIGCAHSIRDNCMPRVAAEEGEADGQLLAEAGPPRSPEVWSLSVAPASKDTEAPSEGLPINDIGLSAGADGASSTFPSIANTPIVPQRDLLVFEDLVIEDVILGSGQFGIVKRGYYRATKERVAVKCVEKKKLYPLGCPLKRENAVRPALERELTILKKCNHPGIIRLRHAIDSSNMLYLIMDLVNGGDLLEYIMQRGSIVEDEAKFLFHQVCVAVCYLHKRGIVHRDLKPENLLLSMEDGVKRCRIADFGFATLLAGQQQQLHSVIGTPSYMAPEIVDTRLNVNGYDQAADLWSLGVILYIMLGGVFPFETDRPIIDQIKAGEFFFPDAQFARVSDSAIDLCCNLLVVDPRRRYSVHQALAHPWLRAESQLDFAR